MRNTTIAGMIVAVYGALLGIWLAARPAAMRAFAGQPLLGQGQTLATSTLDRYRPLRAAGVLWVFLANIATMGLFVGAAFSPALAGRLQRLQFRLPRILNLAGACLFVANGIWSTLVLLFNPGYTPFFAEPAREARLATGGPYALVRHPRYAAEAALNLILAAFTGSWLPLLGILGWPALREQAHVEDAHLLQCAPEEYGRYRARTGAFVPRLTHASEPTGNLPLGGYL